VAGKSSPFYPFAYREGWVILFSDSTPNAEESSRDGKRAQRVRNGTAWEAFRGGEREE